MLQVKLQGILIYGYKQLLIFGYYRPKNIEFITVVHFNISCLVKKKPIPLTEV